MQRVLVTGATGFIGRWTLRVLQNRGFEVHAVSSSVRPEPEQVPEYRGVHFHVCDLLDASGRDALLAHVGATHLLHLAWNVKPGYWTSLDNFAWTAASLSLLDRFRAGGGQRAVLAGTCAEYDWTVAGRCDEHATPSILANPSSAKPYALCKAALQQLAASFAMTSGLSLAWGRVFFQYGPYEDVDQLVPTVIRGLLSGMPVDCTHGRQVRDFLHVADVAEAFVEILTSTATGAINIGSGQPLTLAELIHTCADLIGRRDLVRLGARPADPVDPAVLVPDIQRLHEEIGWRPQIDLTSGLSKTIAWWRERLQE